MPVKEAEVPVKDVSAGAAQWDQCRSAPIKRKDAAVAWVDWNPPESGSREEADWVEVGRRKKMPDSGLGRRAVWFGLWL